MFHCVALFSGASPRLMANGQTNPNLNPGETVTMECRLFGTPLLNITWSGPALDDLGTDRVEITTDGSSSTLTIHSISTEDQGLYKCSHAGVLPVNFNLTVKGRLAFILFSFFFLILLLLEHLVYCC